MGCIPELEDSWFGVRHGGGHTSDTTAAIVDGVEAIADGVDISLGELLDSSSVAGFALVDFQRVIEHQGRDRRGWGRRQNGGIVREQVAVFEDRQPTAVIDVGVRQKDRIHRLRGKPPKVREFLAVPLIETAIDEIASVLGIDLIATASNLASAATWRDDDRCLRCRRHIGIRERIECLVNIVR